MTDGKVELAGIALSEGESDFRPLQILETDVQSIASTTAGKIFLAMKVVEDGDIVLGMSVDRQQTEIVQNQGLAGNNVRKEQSEGKRYKSLALDLPMRIIGAEGQSFPCDHTIRVFWAGASMAKHGWTGYKDFILRLTGLTPKVKYDPKKDGD